MATSPLGDAESSTRRAPSSREFEPRRALPFAAVLRGSNKVTGAGCGLGGKRRIFARRPEPSRHADNFNPSTYDLWDTYLPAFRELITKADFTIAVLGVTLRAADRFIINEEGKITEQENHFDASPMKSYIHHIGLRSMDFNVTKNFYGNTLGWKLVMDKPDLIIFLTGSVFIAFKKADPRDKQYSTFSPFEVGLDHLAITCETEAELHRFTKKITDAGVENTGVKLDAALNKLYVAFKDPDRIAWEFYMR